MIMIQPPGPEEVRMRNQLGEGLGLGLLILLFLAFAALLIWGVALALF